MTLPSLAIAYGGLFDREAGLKAAVTHARKCIQLGGKWRNVDDMGEVMTFLKLKKEWAQEMEQHWSIFKHENPDEVPLQQD